MVQPLPVELQNSIKSLLLQNALFLAIRKHYPSVLSSTLTRYKKKFLSSATFLRAGRKTIICQCINSTIYCKNASKL